MAVRFYQLVVDARDPRSLARFWAAVLGQQVLYQTEDEVIVGSDEHRYPGLCFVPVPESKTVKNRLHIVGSPKIGDPTDCRVSPAHVHSHGLPGPTGGHTRRSHP